MNKLWLIIKREYLVRVKKKSFILTTLLTPLAMAALVVVPILIGLNNSEDTKRIEVIDASGYVLANGGLENTKDVSFEASTRSLEDAQRQYAEDGFDGLLYIPAVDLGERDYTVEYYSDGQLGLITKNRIERRVADAVRNAKVTAGGFDKAALDGLKTEVSMTQREISIAADGTVAAADKQNSAGIATGMGFAMAFIIYIILLVYGNMVMRSVMEEKMNRIVEVMVSSVKPIQLMMGKIIGVSGVGITQILLWVILVPALLFVVGLFIPLDGAAPTGAPGSLSPEQAEAATSRGIELINSLSAQNWGAIIPLFLLYFLGGYFIYAALFAAVGSAAGDDLAESQSLTFPIMLPVILSIVLMQPVIDAPNSSFSVWMSMIPFFSPIIMPARLPFEPPLWQVLLSVVILIASAVAIVWLAARIYRVGILLYGKKVSFGELGKWLFYKN